MGRYAAIAAILVILGCGGLAAPARAASPSVDCTIADKLALAKAGYTKAEIEAACAPATSSRAPAPAAECPSPTQQQGGYVELPHASSLRPLTQPQYPPAAERRGATGKVVLLLSVDAYGRITDGKVDTTSGHPDLDFTALNEALSKWRLLPGTVNGKPQAMPVKLTVNFQLPDKAK